MISAPARTVKAVHGRRTIAADPGHEIGLSAELKERYAGPELAELYSRFSAREGHVDALMRRACLRALVRRFGNGVTIGTNVSIRHPETLEIGDGVWIGEQTVIHGRIAGRCVLGDGVWIGPHSYLDARDLVMSSHVGWGPGAKVLGSAHTGEPVDQPIIKTPLQIGPVRIGLWADIGIGAIILPGITLGQGCVIGAGAVVTRDVPAFVKAAGVPARILGSRRGDGRDQPAQLPEQWQQGGDRQPTPDDQLVEEPS
jgi:acetyltransferase-like isoleucine patch superfamily enzyme